MEAMPNIIQRRWNKKAGIILTVLISSKATLDKGHQPVRPDLNTPIPDMGKAILGSKTKAKQVKNQIARIQEDRVIILWKRDSCWLRREG